MSNTTTDKEAVSQSYTGEYPFAPPTLLGWRPIITAPICEDIIVYNPMVGIYRTHTLKTNKGVLKFPLYHLDGNIGVWFPEPTHWMPVDGFKPNRQI
jgi:hypothetical protein